MSTTKERLEAELITLQTENKRGLYIGGGLVAFVAIYLIWAASQINILLDPEGMAEAATGVALENLPEVSQNLSESIKEAAPTVAQQTSAEIIEIVPIYRLQLEGEMKPIIDEVTGILADASIQSAIASIDKAQDSHLLRQKATSAATDAVISELDGVLIEVLNQKGEDGVTPQESIDIALKELKTIDSEIKKMRRGGGDPQERELLLTWLNIISQQ